jgi:hypothetical protein
MILINQIIYHKTRLNTKNSIVVNKGIKKKQKIILTKEIKEIFKAATLETP